MTGGFVFSLEDLVKSRTHRITQRSRLEFVFYPLFEIVVRNYGMTIQIKSFTSFTVQCQMYVANNIIRAIIAPNITINGIKIQSNNTSTAEMHRTINQWRFSSGQLRARSPIIPLTAAACSRITLTIISFWARAEIVLTFVWFHFIRTFIITLAG